MSPALAENFFTTSTTWETIFLCIDAGELTTLLYFSVRSCLNLYIPKCISLYHKTISSYSSSVLKVEHHVDFLKNSTPETITRLLINSIPIQNEKLKKIIHTRRLCYDSAFKVDRMFTFKGGVEPLLFFSH